MIKIFSFILTLIFIASCSQYQKALKSDDVAVKTEAANKMYEGGKYLKAIRLYEQVAPAYKGKPQAERLFYMYSKSLYNTKQFYLAGYQFENFAASYPKSEKREEASFLASECFYKLSPVYSLDQTDTDKALEKVQKFIDTYPNSEKFGLKSQMDRCCISMPSNIAEGSSRTDKSFSHFLDISLGSSFELQTQIILANHRKYITIEQTNNIENKIEEFQKATMSFQNTLNK